jgi:membrane peptidoglycan carboxypeptidase
MLPSLQGRGRVSPEPELLTHREFEDVGYDDPDSGYDEPLESEEELRRKRKKKIWRRIRRVSYVFLAVMIIAPVVTFFVAYQMVDVPDPRTSADQLDKTVQVQWGDGSPLTTIAPNGKRTLVEYGQIPQQVLHAVFAAEDATFMDNAGFDITGILRAAWNNVTGGQGGGSTITQQYVKKATENEQKTLTRKALEVVKAYKMSNTMDKKDIITAYLNTIYFGRRASGIVEAAKAWYNKPLDQITPQEAALLAGVIQGPSREVKEPEYPEKRWNYVMDKLVENHWMTKQERDASTFPTPIPIAAAGSAQLKPDEQLVWAAALRELDAHDIPLDQISKRGYTVQLTVDPNAQNMARDAITQVMAGQPNNLRQALVAVDPNNGRVVAYYGYNEAKKSLDYAGQAWQNAGSSFKPFDLVALLKTGGGLGDVYDGRSPRTFGGAKISNSSNSNACGEHCTVAEAMKQSVNTVFADIAFNTVGTKAVARSAIEAGIPTNVGAKKIPLEGVGGAPPNVNISIGGDVYQARPIDMAGSYATFAANGTRHATHLVAKVTDPNNGNAVIYDGDKQSAPVAAFDQDPEKNGQIARNVTQSLLPIPESSHVECADQRPCAGKTGTHGCADVPGKTTKADNCAAWMVGYTPQISTAVWVGSDDNSAIKSVQVGKTGKTGIIFGSGLPGKAWQTFMNSYLKNKDKEQFPPYVAIGKSVEDAAKSSASNAAANTSNNQTQQSTTTPSNTPDPHPSDTPTTPPSTSKTTRPSGGPITIPGGGGPGGGGGQGGGAVANPGG